MFYVKKSAETFTFIMTGWRPHLDENQQPAQFHAAIRHGGGDHNSISFENVDGILLHAAKPGGFASKSRSKFQPSTLLSPMRRARDITVDGDERKRPSFQIRKLHKREVKTWKTSPLQTKLGPVSCWRYMRNLDSKISGGSLSNSRQWMISLICWRKCFLRCLCRQKTLIT